MDFLPLEYKLNRKYKIETVRLEQYNGNLKDSRRN